MLLPGGPAFSQRWSKFLGPPKVVLAAHGALLISQGLAGEILPVVVAVVKSGKLR